LLFRPCCPHRRDAAVVQQSASRLLASTVSSLQNSATGHHPRFLRIRPPFMYHYRDTLFHAVFAISIFRISPRFTLELRFSFQLSASPTLIIDVFIQRH